MKKRAIQAFQISVIIVLAAKLLGWIFDFSPSLDSAINLIMFSLIGIAYLFVGFKWSGAVQKWIILVCGGYLIIMNFLPQSMAIHLIGIACLLTPLFIARISAD